MPRNVRGRTRVAKRATKWCAVSAVIPVPNQAGLAIADGIPLCPNSISSADQADPLIGWCRGSLSLSRSGVGEVNPVVAWAIVMMRLDPGTTTLQQVFNPFDTDHLERQDILAMGHIAVPPTVLSSGDVATIARASTVSEITCKVGRKFHRNANMLTLWIVAGGAEDVGYEVTGTIRSLMKF